VFPCEAGSRRGNPARGRCRLHRCLLARKPFEAVFAVSADLPCVRPSPFNVQPPSIRRCRRRLVQPACCWPLPWVTCVPCLIFAPAAINLRTAWLEPLRGSPAGFPVMVLDLLLVAGVDGWSARTAVPLKMLANTRDRRQKTNRQSQGSEQVYCCFFPSNSPDQDSRGTFRF